MSKRTTLFALLWAVSMLAYLAVLVLQIHGWWLIVLPYIAMLLSIPFFSKTSNKIRMTYFVAIVLMALVGWSISFYLAFYGGDQGGIGAYFVHLLVGVIYTLLSVVIALIRALTRCPGCDTVLPTKDPYKG